jgi:hypothetical protein
MRAAFQDPSGAPDRPGLNYRASQGRETLQNLAGSFDVKKEKGHKFTTYGPYFVHDLVKSQPRRKRCRFRQRRHDEIVWAILNGSICPYLAALLSSGQA